MGSPGWDGRGTAAGVDLCFLVLASSAILGADICSWLGFSYVRALTKRATFTGTRFPSALMLGSLWTFPS